MRRRIRAAVTLHAGENGGRNMASLPLGPVALFHLCLASDDPAGGGLRRATPNPIRSRNTHRLISLKSAKFAPRGRRHTRSPRRGRHVAAPCLSRGRRHAVSPGLNPEGNISLRELGAWDMTRRNSWPLSRHANPNREPYTADCTN